MQVLYPPPWQGLESWGQVTASYSRLHSLLSHHPPHTHNTDTRTTHAQHTHTSHTDTHTPQRHTHTHTHVHTVTQTQPILAHTCMCVPTREHIQATPAHMHVFAQIHHHPHACITIYESHALAHTPYTHIHSTHSHISTRALTRARTPRSPLRTPPGPGTRPAFCQG